jgi:hypothetical protein
MAGNQAQQDTQRAAPSRWGVRRWAIWALILVAVALSGRYGWKKYDDFEWQKAMKSRKQADISLTEISSWKLFDAYAKDKNAAISKYSGKRFFVGGRAFGAALVGRDELGVKSKPDGVVKFTVGSGGPDDPGNKYILLLAAHYWEIAYSSLPTGGLDIAACTIDPGKSGILTYGDDEYIYADDCSTVVAGLEKQSQSPFSSN